MAALVVEAGAFVTTLTLVLYFIVIAIQSSALVAESIVSRRFPPKIYFSDVSQNLGVAIPIIGFIFGSLDLMVVGALLLAVGVLTSEVRYRHNRVIDASLSVTAILSIGSMSLVSVIA